MVSSFGKGFIWPFLIGVYLMAILVLTGYSCGDTDEGPPATETVREETGPSLSPDQVLKNRAHEVLAAVTDLDTAYPGNLITSARLDEMLENPGDAGNLYLLDTRPRDEWESQGHIEGATWIQMQEIADPGNLENLPRDRLIVCISSTGHTAVQVASVLRWLGYDAVALEFGMAGWTGVPARQVILDDVEGGLAGVYPAAMQPPMPAATGAAAAANGFRRPSDAELDILVETARTFLHDNLFEKEYPFNHIFADKLYQRLQDPALIQDTMIIDIRALDDPDTTIHISSPHGHVNLGTLDEQQYLDTLPTDQLIVVVGATGRKAGQVTPILRMLGYDAVTLRSGMTAWAPVPDSQRVLDQITGADYPVVR